MKKHYFFYALFFFSTFLLASAKHQESESQPVLLILPSFLHSPISTTIPGAQRTVITAALMKENVGKEPTITYLEPSWKTTQRSFMKRFIEKGCSTLSATLATLHPRFLRDEHQVIQVAIIESPNPITASTVLAPEFMQQFSNIFGPEFLIAIPTANRIYVFSKLLSPLDTLAPTIRDDYKLSSSPLTTEIFEVNHGTLHAVGALD